ncbi:MAG: T9SS type A sorting domain-containing protein [Candidatus Competibacteraceae bacterium]|nr:T9SS type A sorting domain-containing protein [Candidatus Competibacteraceae bacterium]
MRIIYFLLLVIVLHLPLTSQYLIGYTSTTFNDPARSNRAVDAKIFYPSLNAGANVPSAPGQYPLVIVGHGFAMGIDAYEHMAERLVPLGYIVVLCNTETSFSPNHQEFGRDLLFLSNEIKQLSILDQLFPLYGNLNLKSAIMGHSMGGGATILAASYANLSEVDCIAAFAPAETTPSAITAAASVQVPTLIFAGQGDMVTPPANHQTPIYNAISSPCATYIQINGGGHCLFAKSNVACDFGETMSGSSISISRESQQDIMFNLLIPYLNYFLKDQSASLHTFRDTLTISSRFTYQTKNCETLSLHQSGNSSFSINWFNISASHILQFSGNFTTNEQLGVDIIDMNGRQLYQKSFEILSGHHSISIQLPALSSGYYLARFSTSSFHHTRKFIITKP